MTLAAKNDVMGERGADRGEVVIQDTWRAETRLNALNIYASKSLRRLYTLQLFSCRLCAETSSDVRASTSLLGSTLHRCDALFRNRRDVCGCGVGQPRSAMALEGTDEVVRNVSRRATFDVAPLNHMDEFAILEQPDRG